MHERIVIVVAINETARAHARAGIAVASIQGAGGRMATKWKVDR